MKLSELQQGDYELSETPKESSKLMDIAKGTAGFGARLGGAVVQSGLGLSELALKAAEKVTGKVGLEAPNEFLEKAAGTAKELREDVFGERLRKQFGGKSGKLGELTGIGATFLAPTKSIISAQKVVTALAGTGKVARIGAGLGRAGVEGVGTGLTEFARTGGDVEAAKEAGKFGFGISAGLQGLGGLARATFWPDLAKSTTRALGIQGKTTGGRVLPQVEKKVTGLGVLKKYAPEVTVKDPHNLEVKFEPNKATFHEVLQAWNKIRQNIYGKYSTISENAGKTVDVDISKIGEGLSEVTKGARTGAYKTAANNILGDLVDNFGQVDDAGNFIGFRKIPPKDLETYLSDLYNEAGATIAGRSDKAHGEIAAATANHLRGYLDDAIERASGPEYQALKGEYSALKSIEQDLVRRFQQEARQVGGGLTDYVNIFSSGDIIGGLLYNQPQQVAKGLTQGTMGTLLQHLKRPDRYLQRAFKLIDTKGVGNAAQRLFGTTGQLSAREQKFLGGIQEYIKNPKIGLMIEDVSKKKIDNFVDISQTLRGTKGMTADDIMQKYPDIKLTRDVPATDIYGNKVKIPEGEALTPYELKGNKVLLQDGETYIVSKNQFQNIKGNAVEATGKPFAPELEGLEESVRTEGIKPSDQYPYKQSTKYSQYTLPNGENYREVLIKAPEAKGGKPISEFEWADAERAGDVMGDYETYLENFKKGNALGSSNFMSSHWDEPNVISHLRLNDRTYKGKKVTFMEELQSDWARAGREKGFATDITKDTAKQQGFSVNKAKDTTGGEAYFIDNPTDEFFYRKGFTNTGFDTEAEAWNSIVKKLKETSDAVPNNPNLKNWQELSIKRALQDAVNNKSDYFAWINGEQTSARYNLATHVESVKWFDPSTAKTGRKSIVLEPKSGGKRLEFELDKNGVINQVEDGVPLDWKGKKLDEVLGKGLADQILGKETGSLSGEGLKFGGEWATNLYDKQIKNIVEDVTGGKVETLDMGLPIEGKYQNIIRRWEDTYNKNPLTNADLKVGLKLDIHDNKYSITETLGNGKFKALPVGKVPGVSDTVPQIFDISTKTTTQQGIKLTPEIKAKIRGEAPQIKASGELFGAETTVSVRGQSAVEIISARKSGEIRGAFSNPEIGDIDIMWGTVTGEGGGISKIIQEHPEVVDILDDILHRAKVVGGRSGRIYMETSDGYRAVVRTDFDGKPKQWLLTAYKKD